LFAQTSRETKVFPTYKKKGKTINDLEAAAKKEIKSRAQFTRYDSKDVEEEDGEYVPTLCYLRNRSRN
jgi:hypothetical protein